MAFLQKSLEPLTALGCGLAAGAAGVLDGGLAAGAVVGLAGLISRFREGCTRHGLDEPALLKKMQMQMLREWDQHDLPQADRDIITLADAAMAKHLPDCMLSRAELANTSVDADEPYPQKASRLIADQLAKRDAIFSVTLAKTEPLARRFARAAVESALNLAREDKDYAILLTVDLLLAGNRAHAVTHAQNAATHSMLEQIMATMAAQGTPAGVPKAVIFAIAERVGAITDNVDAAVAQIHAAIDILLEQSMRAERGTNFGELVDGALRRIAERNSHGEFDSAAAEGERAFAVLQEQEEALKAAQIAIAETNIVSARIRMDAKAVARWTIKCLGLQDVDADIAVLREASLIARDSGNNTGLLFEFDIATEFAVSMVAIAVTNREKGDALNTLGMTLSDWGELSQGAIAIDRIDRSVMAYDAAIALTDIDTLPVEWGILHNNRGTARNARGELDMGTEGSTHLARAVQDYEAALTVRDAQSFPDEWATTQCNRGVVLTSLGTRNDGSTRNAFLVDAVGAFDAALLTCDPSTNSSDWATIQSNKAHTLIMLSKSLKDLEFLYQASLALEAAFEHREKESMPVPWAVVVENMGLANEVIADLVEEQTRPKFLKLAEVNYADALEVFAQERGGVHFVRCSGGLKRVRDAIAGLKGDEIR